MKTKSEIKAILIQLLANKADFALLFGSWANGEAQTKKESDVDCAAYFYPQIVAGKLYFDIAQQFEEIVGRKLDLICLNSADIIIAAQVVTTGEELFSHSKNQLEAYCAQVMSRYFDFKRSRKVIEDNILMRPNYG